MLFFSGKPVKGSQAIDAQFVAEILSPFVEVVKSQYAATKHGRVGERGPRRDEDEARLMLAGTPRGSFGLELAPPESDDLFAEGRLADVLVKVTRLIEAASDSDEAFLLSLEEIAERAFLKVPEFFKVLRDYDAGFRMQTGDIEFEISQDRIRQAHERVSTSREERVEVQIRGTFRGAILDTWRFDFRNEAGETFSGKLGGDKTEEDVAEWLAQTNLPSVGTFTRVTRITSANVRRVTYVLLDLREATA